MTVVFGVLLIPAVASAEVVPLAPLPTRFGDTNTLPGYISTIFFLSITVGAVLAVLRIVWGGFRYMTSEAIGNVKEARDIITQALVGLLLLLSVWLILNQINPQITSLDALRFSPLEDATSADLVAQREEARRAVEQVKRATVGRTFATPLSDRSSRTAQARDAYIQSCKDRGEDVEITKICSGKRYSATEETPGSCWFPRVEVRCK